MAFVTTLKVRFYELDPYNHLNHATFVQYFEAARIELLEEVGIHLGVLRDAGYQIVVSELAIRYLGSATGGDVVTVETEIVELRRVTSRWRQRLRRGADVLAEQDITVATTDTRGRPTRHPAMLADALRPHLAG